LRHDESLSNARELLSDDLWQPLSALADLLF